ncbi:DUF4254 domain-containing protein [Nocardia pseudobrasiliensis]|uniref:Uncharacterized protein DUF4254 n=1 Tax=Nocardia pseudobrasiliensis TaxID=45979 RepID=A0A370I786_9NOCA|nr:DUF4254 domain-containing protein [Nocardia pseudobrasiliensis]RDI66589.1 uncharacterized protein DUF4254 [Nocardia pseudobrasiliensis]
MLSAAYDLAELHERRLGANPECVREIDELRADLVNRIDRWVRETVSPAPGSARIHTETIGAIVDRLAQLTADAFAALAGTEEWGLGDAWERLAELAVGYEDLIDELTSGRRRLPGGP